MAQILKCKFAINEVPLTFDVLSNNFFLNIISSNRSGGVIYLFKYGHLKLETEQSSYF